MDIENFLTSSFCTCVTCNIRDDVFLYVMKQKVTDCINCSAELLMSRASQDAEIALEVIAEALTISVYSEKLIEMKVQILFMVLHLLKTLCTHQLVIFLRLIKSLT